MPPEKPRPKKMNKQNQSIHGAGENEYCYGKNSVEAILTHQPGRVFKVMVAQELAGDKRLRHLIDLAQREGRTTQQVPKSKLDQMAQGHQGIIAMVAPKPLLDLYDLLAMLKAWQQSQPPLLLALDEITDPHNFGALIRVAAASGVHAIIIPKTGHAGITPVVSKASAGTVEQVNIVVVPNLVDAMNRLKDAGIWWVGAAVNPKATVYYTHDFTGATGLVLGSEGKGLRRLVSETCDHWVNIPMVSGVESLNVSVAGGVLLFEARRQRLK